jgi:polyadenylation factor subunit 2
MNNLAAWAGHREAIRGLSYSPDDARFATCSDDQTIKIWAFDEMREEKTLTGTLASIQCSPPLLGLHVKEFVLI